MEIFRLLLFLKFLLTGKGLAKAGIRKTEIQTKPEPSKNHFRFFKITKNKKTKWFFAAKSAEIFKMITSTPLLPNPS